MEQTGKAPRQCRTNQQILQVLDEFKRSGLTVVDFCKQQHINVGNFNKWKSRYMSASVTNNQKSGFAKLNIATSSTTLFAEVNGIRLYQPVSASFLKELM